MITWEIALHVVRACHLHAASYSFYGTGTFVPCELWLYPHAKSSREWYVLCHTSAGPVQNPLLSSCYDALMMCKQARLTNHLSSTHSDRSFPDLNMAYGLAGFPQDIISGPFVPDR